MSVRASTDDWQTLAKTLWGEARGEMLQGLVAVAWVVVNRLRAATWYGSSITACCLKPYQFSCWNTNDPNRQYLDGLAPNDLDYRRCLGAAALVLSGDIPDPTNGATSYHVASMNPKPEWAGAMVPTIQIGSHLFYREVPA